MCVSDVSRVQQAVNFITMGNSSREFSFANAVASGIVKPLVLSKWEGFKLTVGGDTTTKTNTTL